LIIFENNLNQIILFIFQFLLVFIYFYHLDELIEAEFEIIDCNEFLLLKISVDG
jgi:hypothetical protein